MPSSVQIPVSFNAMMHFIVVPDRYYKIELHAQEQKLYFLKTGSQFDLEHPGSVNRFKMSDGSARPSPPRRKLPLIVAGIAVTVGSLALLLILAHFGWIVGHLIFLTAFGIILIMAGIVTPSRPYATSAANSNAALDAHPHNFALASFEIRTATLTLPKRPNQAGSLRLALDTGKSLKLLVKSAPDVAAAHTTLHRFLGSKYSTIG